MRVAFLQAGDTELLLFQELGDQPLEKPLGEILVATLLRISFYPSFTVKPRSVKAPVLPEYPGLDPNILW